MKRANLTAPRELTFEEVEKPAVGPGEVLVEVKACGICGSDIHSYQGEHPFVHPPIVLGHEFSGLVAEVGADVEGFRPGDKVIAEPNLPCGECYNCRHGRYNICEELEVVGNVGYDGAFADFISLPQEKVIQVPDTLSFQQAAMVEPAAVGVHGVRISEQELGDRVLVIGAGTIGQLLAQAAKRAGAESLMITDLISGRLEVARELGADFAINPAELDKGLEEYLVDKFGPDKADLIYECVGLENTIEEAIEVARKGTEIVIVGVPQGEVSVNMAFVQDRELNLQGSLMYVRKDFHTAIRLIERGEMNVDKLITHQFSFEELEEAFQLAIDEEKMDQKLKVMVNF